MTRNDGPRGEYSPAQLWGLVVLRVLIGWHLLYEGIAKALDPYWSAAGFLKQSQWILSGPADLVVSHPSALSSRPPIGHETWLTRHRRAPAPAIRGEAAR